jgi:hypothetical protein
VYFLPVVAANVLQVLLQVVVANLLLVVAI